MRRTVVVATIAGLIGATIAVPVAVYASHSFNDVPNSNTFHADIAWLADAGVTRGCNPPANTEFCPDDPVTRAQMSAFMRRFAQYLGAEDGTPAQADHANTADSADNADNADMLQGNTVAELVPRAAFNSTIDAADGQNLTLPVEITAPAPGVLILSGTVNAFNGSNLDVYDCVLRVDGGFVPGTYMVTQLDGDADVNEQGGCTATGAVTVDAGTHTVDLSVGLVASSTILGDASVWVMWVPFDGTGSVPTSVTQLGDPDAGIDEERLRE